MDDVRTDFAADLARCCFSEEVRPIEFQHCSCCKACETETDTLVESVLVFRPHPVSEPRADLLFGCFIGTEHIVHPALPYEDPHHSHSNLTTLKQSNWIPCRSEPSLGIMELALQARHCGMGRSVPVIAKPLRLCSDRHTRRRPFGNRCP